MSRLRDLLIKRRSEVTPLIHWDFSGKSNADAGTIVEDLTGNGYDLELKNFALDNVSGYNGYPIDFRKWGKAGGTQYDGSVISIYENKIVFDGTISDDYVKTGIVLETQNLSILGSLETLFIKVNGLKENQQLRVINQTPVPSIITSIGNGINFIDVKNYNNPDASYPALYIIYDATLNNGDKTLNNVTVEIFPLYPDQLVFNNTKAQTVKPVKINTTRGFTVIIRRQFVQEGIRTVVLGQQGIIANRSDFFIRDYAPSEDSRWIVYNFGTAREVPVPNGDLMWTTLTKFFNGQVVNVPTPPFDSPDDAPLMLGSYTYNSAGNGNFAVREVYIFDRDLTQSQIEKFISDNMIPLPEVYYDVEKQSTLNEHTTKDKLIDFSGNQHHGTLHNFTFLSPGDEGYYPDYVNGFIKANQGIWSKPYITLDKESTFYGTAHTVLLSAYESASEDMQVTAPAIKIRVHKIEDCIINCFPQIEGSSTIPEGATPFVITSPGDYTIPSQTFSVTAGKRYSIFTLMVNSGNQQDILVEFLGEGDGWGYQRTVDAFELQSTYHPQGNDTSSSFFYVFSKLVSKSNFVTPIVVPKYRIKVTGLTEIRNNNKKAYIECGYDIAYTDPPNKIIRFKGIIKDGEYEIDTYVLSPSYIDKYDEIDFIRPIAISYQFIPTDNNVTIEFLPDEGDCLRFDASKDTYVSLDTLTKGFKTVFMVTEPQNNTTVLYDQRTNPDDTSVPFAVFSVYGSIAYNARNNGGVTYINGELNTSITTEMLTNVKHCLTIVNDTVTDDDSTTLIIGDRIDQVNDGQYATTMKLYKFLGFKEALSEKQIKMVIEKYGLNV